MTSEIKNKLKEKAKIYKKYAKSGFVSKYKDKLEQKKLKQVTLLWPPKKTTFWTKEKNSWILLLVRKSIGIY